MRKKSDTLSRLGTVPKRERVLMSYHYLQKMDRLFYANQARTLVKLQHLFL